MPYVIQAGQYSNASSYDRCDICMPGFYSEAAGATRCTACAPGRVSDPPQNATRCKDCEMHEYIDNNQCAGAPKIVCWCLPLICSCAQGCDKTNPTLQSNCDCFLNEVGLCAVCVPPTQTVTSRMAACDIVSLVDALAHRKKVHWHCQQPVPVRI